MNLTRLGLLDLFYFSWFNNMRAARDARLATTRVRCWAFYTLESGEVEVRFGYSAVKASRLQCLDRAQTGRVTPGRLCAFSNWARLLFAEIES